MVTFAKIPASPNAVIQIVAPLDTSLLEGARMKVDQDEIGKLPFFKCAPIGCAAEGAISDDVISKLLTDKNIIITDPRNIVPAKGFGMFSHSTASRMDIKL